MRQNDHLAIQRDLLQAPSLETIVKLNCSMRFWRQSTGESFYFQPFHHLHALKIPVGEGESIYMRTSGG